MWFASDRNCFALMLKSGEKPVDGSWASGRIRGLFMGRHYSKLDSGLAIGSVDNVEMCARPQGKGTGP